MKQYVWIVYRTSKLVVTPFKADIFYDPRTNTIISECLGEL